MTNDFFCFTFDRTFIQYFILATCTDIKNLYVDWSVNRNIYKMPRTKQQFEEIREKKKTLILDTALKLFATEGYHTTSISKIATKAKISKGLLYNYFKSKDDLIIEIVNTGMNKLMQSFDPDHDSKLTDEEFIFFIHENFRILENNLHYWKLYFSIFTQPQVYDLVKDNVNNLINNLMFVLVSYYKRKGAEKPELEALLFGALMDGISLQYVMDPDNFPLDEVKQMIIEKYSYNNVKR